MSALDPALERGSAADTGLGDGPAGETAGEESGSEELDHYLLVVGAVSGDNCGRGSFPESTVRLGGGGGMQCEMLVGSVRLDVVFVSANCLCSLFSFYILT